MSCNRCRSGQVHFCECRSQVAYQYQIDDLQEKLKIAYQKIEALYDEIRIMAYRQGITLK